MLPTVRRRAPILAITYTYVPSVHHRSRGFARSCSHEQGVWGRVRSGIHSSGKSVQSFPPLDIADSRLCGYSVPYVPQSVGGGSDVALMG